MQEERREEKEIKAAALKRKIEHYFSKTVKPRTCMVWDLVLKEMRMMMLA